MNIITPNREGNLRDEFKLVLKRPALFTGKDRFDYLDIFLRAYYDCSKWNSDYDIQKWLLINESIILPHAITLTGWQLVPIYYGNKNAAIDSFGRLVDEIAFSTNEFNEELPALVVYDIYKYCKYPTLRTNRFFIDEKSDLNSRIPEIKNIFSEMKKSYENIIPIAKRMINDTYEDLYIYIRYQAYFFQIRFVYLKEGKWIDLDDLKNLDDYYFNLVVLHAYAELLQKENHKSHIISIHTNNDETKIAVKKTKDVWYDIYNNDLDISFADKKTLYSQYNNWKNEIVEGKKECKYGL